MRGIEEPVQVFLVTLWFAINKFKIITWVMGWRLYNVLNKPNLEYKLLIIYYVSFYIEICV